MEMLERAATAIEPRERYRLLDWSIENVFTQDGKPYDHAAYPHIGAPGGPMDAFDCPQYLSIWLQWASRLGKSFFGQSALLKTADCAPCPMMFASSDQKLAIEVTKRTYAMLEFCERLSRQLPPRHKWRQDLITLRDCRCYVAWSRSVSTLADKAVRVGQANEIDKWEHPKTAKEADPLALFGDRFKEFPSHKRIYESTPAMKHSSRIERGRLGSTNCSYWVPCPHCRRYQLLDGSTSQRMERIIWDKGEGGRSDKDVAHRTARYICQHCKGEIRDQHRGSMMRSGVWAPEGCGVNDTAAIEVAAATDRKPFAGWSTAEWITGTPLRDGRDAGYRLSSFYALSLSWGDIAAKFLDCQNNVQEYRNFVNQWLGDTWSETKEEYTWEQIVTRLVDAEISRGVVPKWASMVTVGIDRQGDDRHPWVVDAWGPDRRSATIAYGVSGTIEEAEAIAATHWPHKDGGPAVKPSMVFIDSGHRPRGVHEACDRLRAREIPANPCRGSTTALTSDYNVVILGENTSNRGATLVHVDTIRSQDWIENAIYRAKPNETGGFALYNGGAHEHEDFVLQLMNDAPIIDNDAKNNARENWKRINTNIPNDYRDCKRYSYVAMLLATRHGPILPRVRRPAVETVVQDAPSRIRQMRIRR